MITRAWMHKNGEGCPPNNDEAIRLLDQAIDLGHSAAMHARAVMHFKGEGDDQNYDEAIRLFDQAIDLGHSDAMHERAVMHYHGEGGDQNYDEAIRLFDQAVDLGNREAICNRALMHEKGQGGPQNHDKASQLYFHNFCLNKSEPSLDALKVMAHKNIPIAQYYLLLAYLETEPKQAESFYLNNAQNLMPILLEKTLTLIDELPKQQTLAEQHIELLQLIDIPPNLLHLWRFVQFRLEIKAGDYQAAYFLTLKYDETLKYDSISRYSTASEYYELGNLALSESGDEELTPQNKMHCFSSACLLFIYAHLRDPDDKQIHRLLLLLFREREALELGQKTTYAYQEDIFSVEEEELKLMGAFGNLYKPYQQEITQIIQYQETHSEELTFSEHQILYRLSRRLSYGIPLTDSLNQPHIKQQISDSPLLAKDALFKPLLSDQACKDILKGANRGQRIYETLPNYALTKTNLKILAEAKEDVVDYLKQSVDKSTDQVIDDILDNNSNESVYKSYFYVQRGFFKPKLGCGTLKKLQGIHHQKSLGDEVTQTKNSHCSRFSFFNFVKRLAQRLIKKNSSMTEKNSSNTL